MRSSILSLCALSASLINASPVGLGCYDESAFAPEDIIQRDVLIVGGGATGTYAAVRLRDQNKTVAVVEQADKLGGHVNTFRDPATGAPIDYGVQAFIQNDQTTEFFKRFDVALNASVLSPFPSRVVDFKTGFAIPNATAVDPNQLVGPLANYLFATLNFDFLAEGAYDIPENVPEDLLLPFGQFVAKHNLTDVVQVVWIFAHGVGNLLETPTLYVLQNFGQAHLLGLSSGYLYAPGGNQEVYDKAGAFLGKDVLYSSTVVASERTDAGVKAVVKTANGRKLIKAKKLLITIPPTTKNLQPFDLNESETSIFDQWQHVPYYVGVVSNSGLPSLTNFLNVDVTAPAFLPQTPFVWRLETVGVPGYQTVKVIGEADSAKAQGLVTGAVSRISAAVNGTATSEAQFSAWEEHANLQLHVSPEAVKAGFYRNLYALQGKRSTYYTGNAWCSDYSPLLWAFTEKRVLPSL
ncbi:Beta-cyclopiazonate dehydrogenase 2 [Colletotrichum truncatum]|uniref:Beta-cyclopiazonate dehydrogenase 2 n=1 Tax=Colletotrichum truncatum TaxID=5467 RepID=A0ACC3Z2N1_COLTU|nr:Beta-cyclopiazonate dehydrogenase 2 [Colletotrichum truncatum]KAF6782669.1 Beta-cyclopiazonate dehydrogenase 2 [Colletotrichum truncatum]